MAVLVSFISFVREGEAASVHARSIHTQEQISLSTPPSPVAYQHFVAHCRRAFNLQDVYTWATWAIKLSPCDCDA